MISKQQALGYSIFHQEGAVDPDNGWQCAVWRRAGQTATWDGHPDTFSIPVVNDAGISGAITEVTGRLYHAEYECPRHYVSDPAQAFRAGSIAAMQFTDGEITDVDPADVSTRASLGSREDFKHRILRRQLGEKIDEIQGLLGLTDLQMLEVVARWMQHKVRDLRDIEVDET